MLIRKLFLLLTLSLFSASFAQQPLNRFEEEDAKIKQDQADNASPYGDEVIESGPGNPGDPVPIDNYIPLLILTAVGIIVYRTQKKNAIQN